MELPAHRLFLSDSINFQIQAWEFIQVDLTLQKRITRMPRFIRNCITIAASEMELHLPRLGCLGSRSLGFQREHLCVLRENHLRWKLRGLYYLAQTFSPCGCQDLPMSHYRKWTEYVCLDINNENHSITLNERETIQTSDGGADSPKSSDYHSYVTAEPSWGDRR